MSNWSETQLTAKGRALDAKVTAGLTTLTFTRMKIGSGNATPEEIDTMTDLKSPRLVIGISSCEVSEADPTICSVIGVAKSDDVETSFLVKEQGLFATDPDDGEILYAVMLDSEPDKMPNQDVSSPLSIMYQINIVSDNAADITAIIDPAGLVTVQTMNASIGKHNESQDAHKELIGSLMSKMVKTVNNVGPDENGNIEIDITPYAADRQLSNLDTANLACHVVVDSYYDATTGDWYRVYDDGWVEQGGLGIADRVEKSFLKPFINTNYCIVGTIILSVNNQRYMLKIEKPSATTYIPTIVSTDAIYVNLPYTWYACGMEAKE